MEEKLHRMELILVWRRERDVNKKLQNLNKEKRV